MSHLIAHQKHDVAGPRKPLGQPAPAAHVAEPAGEFARDAATARHLFFVQPRDGDFRFAAVGDTQVDESLVVSTVID